MSDRYVFAKADPEHPDSPTCVSTIPTGIPAPDPADFAALVEATEVGDTGLIIDAALALVRNMEARS